MLDEVPLDRPLLAPTFVGVSDVLHIGLFIDPEKVGLRHLMEMVELDEDLLACVGCLDFGELFLEIGQQEDTGLLLYLERPPRLIRVALLEKSGA